MNSTTASADEHERTALLIPWLVNRTLPASEAADAERHIASCPECRADFAGQQRLYEAMRAEPKVVFASEPAWQRLQVRLDGLEDVAVARVPPSTEEHLELASEPRAAPARRAGRPERSPRPRSRMVTRWLAAAVVIQALGLGTFAWHSYRGPAGAPPDFRTLSSSSQASGSEPRIRVLFSPDVSIERVGTLLRGIGARLVDGPSGANVYTLGLSRPDISPAEMDAKLKELRSHAEVQLAEPVDANSSTVH